MSRRRPQILILAAPALALGALALTLAAPVNAQSIKGLDASGGGAGSPASESDTPSQFLIEPEAKIQGDQIKQQTYRSQAAGQNKNWNLDIGRFQAPIDEDPNNVAEDLKDSNFSGMRFRLPLRGGIGN